MLSKKEKFSRFPVVIKTPGFEEVVSNLRSISSAGKTAAGRAVNNDLLNFRTSDPISIHWLLSASGIPGVKALQKIIFICLI